MSTVTVDCCWPTAGATAAGKKVLVANHILDVILHAQAKPLSLSRHGLEALVSSYEEESRPSLLLTLSQSSNGIAR